MTPDIVSYNALISACEKGKEIHEAFDACAVMLRQAMKPNMVKRLGLNGHQLSSLPESTGQLTELRMLDAGRN